MVNKELNNFLPFSHYLLYLYHIDHLNNTNIEKGDTTKIVRREIVNSIIIQELLKQKRQNLEIYLKDQEMPKIDEYDKVLKKNVTTQKISQHTSAMPNIKDGEINKEKKDFKNSLKENYRAKQVQWEVDNYQNDDTEKLDRERRKETKMFLKQVKKRPRFAQEYVDGYSMRDPTVNQNIIQLNKILGKKFYDKKKLNRKVDDFLNNIFKSSPENEENSLFNSIKSNKDEDLKKKIRENLKIDQEENIHIEFGNKENEIVLALVNSAQKTGVQFFKEERNDYDDFLKFREKVISNEKEKELEEHNKLKSENIKKNKRMKEIRRNSYNFDANKSKERFSGYGK
jgi:hypothetical protein